MILTHEEALKRARKVTERTTVDSVLPYSDAEQVWAKIVAALERVRDETAERCAEIANSEKSIEIREEFATLPHGVRNDW